MFTLYAGSDFPTPPSSYSPASPEGAAGIDPFSSVHSINVPQLEAVCIHNSFVPIPLKPWDVHLGERPDASKKSVALYTLPSMINNSCLPNASWLFIGDVMVVRAAQTIRCGDEITIGYSGGALAQREKLLRQYLPSGCQCQLCQEESEGGTATIRRREAIYSEVEADDFLDRTSLQRMLEMEKALAATYSDACRLRCYLGELQRNIATKIRFQYSASTLAVQRQQAIKMDIQALISMGFVLEPGGRAGELSSDSMLDLPISTTSFPAFAEFLQPMMIMVQISWEYKGCGDRRQAIRWLRAAFWGECISFVLAPSPDKFHSSFCGCGTLEGSFYVFRGTFPTAVRSFRSG